VDPDRPSAASPPEPGIPTGYDWFSIVLHWLTAAIVIAMWVIGSMSQAAETGEYRRLVGMHTTMGVGFYLLLWLRIIWRFKQGHPGPLPAQRGVFYEIGKYTHYGMLVAMAGMLITGPLMVWTAGEAIALVSYELASPFGRVPLIQPLLRELHGIFALALGLGIAAHVLGTLKHMIINRDGTFDKMVMAEQPPTPDDPDGTPPA
jgi:cytochrome b561